MSRDGYDTGFRLASPAAAQTELYVLMRPSVAQTSDFDCSFGDMFGDEAIYIAGAGTTRLELNAGCTFVNNTGIVVNFGESASDEICLAGIYRYPPKPPTSVSPLDCAMGHEI